MGGSIFVGIKKDGVEHLLECGTNSLNGQFCLPDFQRGGPAVDELISWGDHMARVKFIQYGVVLIDFDSKKVLSFNGYSSLGVFMVYSHPNVDLNLFDAYTMQQFLDDGYIKKVALFDKCSTPMQLSDLQDMVTDLKKGAKSRQDMLRVTINSSFEISNNLDGNIGEVWPVVRKFLHDNGWKSKSWTVDHAMKKQERFEL